MVLRDDKERQGLLFNERQLLEPRPLFKWERLCKCQKELGTNSKGFRSLSLYIMGEDVIPGGLQLAWATDSGLGLSYSHGPAAPVSGRRYCNSAAETPVSHSH